MMKLYCVFLRCFIKYLLFTFVFHVKQCLYSNLVYMRLYGFMNAYLCEYIYVILLETTISYIEYVDSVILFLYHFYMVHPGREFYEVF